MGTIVNKVGARVEELVADWQSIEGQKLPKAALEHIADTLDVLDNDDGDHDGFVMIDLADHEKWMPHLYNLRTTVTQQVEAFAKILPLDSNGLALKMVDKLWQGKYRFDSPVTSAVAGSTVTESSMMSGVYFASLDVAPAALEVSPVVVEGAQALGVAARAATSTAVTMTEVDPVIAQLEALEVEMGPYVWLRVAVLVAIGGVMVYAFTKEQAKAQAENK